MSDLIARAVETPTHRCAQCNGEPDGLEQLRAGGVWLHRECEAFWLGNRRGLPGPAVNVSGRRGGFGFIRSVETDAGGWMKRDGSP